MSANARGTSHALKPKGLRICGEASETRQLLQLPERLARWSGRQSPLHHRLKCLHS